MNIKITKYQNRMTGRDKQKILELHSIGASNIDISKIIKCSNTAIRVFLKKNHLQSNIPKRDRSRPCKVCGKIFTPKYNDGFKKEHYKTCSPQCTSAAISLSKIKYTQNKIDHVIKLKKELLTNNEIVEITQVNINKIKEIIKNNNLQLTPKQGQINAYEKKLEKNPNCMKNMRDTRLECPTNKFNQKINNIKNILKNPNNKHSIPYLCKKEGLCDTSVRRSMHLRRWEGLIKKQSSSDECEIFDFIKEHLPNIEIQQGNRTILKPKEIDIYIPSLNLGIEYCGLYWHNEFSPQPRDTNYHYNKMLEANKQGIRLITIFEDEWQNKQFQVKSFLKSVLNVIDQKIFARKCNIQEVNQKEAKDFLEKYHIQGKTIFKIALGLYYKDELLGLITGNVHHRQKGNNPPFVLNRLVFKEGVQIVGGTSKLLKHLIDYAKIEGYQTLISWSDNRWSEGNVYGKCGFILESNLKPDYSYVVGETGTRQSKQSNKKKCLLKKGAIGTMNNTERELALTMNLFRIWDCGKKRWMVDL
jgi:hypothetical protein